MSFKLVRQLQEKAVAVDQACRVLDVSRSGYYAVRRRSLALPAVCEASVQLKAAFAASGGAYGSRRLLAVDFTRFCRHISTSSSKLLECQRAQLV